MGRMFAYAPKVAPEPFNGGGGGVGRDNDDHQWRSFDNNSVNAVSFGFVATAILISMFLVMAIFEKFLRQRSSSGDSDGGGGGGGGEVIKRESSGSPKMSVYSKGVSVLMPGDDFPTFLAHHVPRAST